MEFTAHGDFNTSIGDVTFHMTKEVPGRILKVQRKGIRSMSSCAPIGKSILEVRKLPNLSTVG